MTTSYNIYGVELVLTGGAVYWTIYFNGAKAAEAAKGIVWQSSPPAILIGWNPGSSPYVPATLELDWVRVWKK